MTKRVQGRIFDHVARIELDRDESGRPEEFMPHAFHRNRRRLSLHRYGAGPFCRFKVPRSYRRAGVYVLTVDGGVAYGGKCVELSKRFNGGYGTISPRNCFKGGRSTNCKVNGLILESIKVNRRIDLWFHQTDDRGRIENELLRHLKPPWNAIV